MSTVIFWAMKKKFIEHQSGSSGLTFLRRAGLVNYDDSEYHRIFPHEINIYTSHGYSVPFNFTQTVVFCRPHALRI